MLDGRSTSKLVLPAAMLEMEERVAGVKAHQCAKLHLQKIPYELKYTS